MGVTNTSLFIHPSTNEYPLSLRDIRRRHPGTSFPTEPTAELLEEYGYRVVSRVPRPEGDVVEESTPVEIDGQFEMTWLVRDFTEEELKEDLENKKNDLLSQIEMERDERLSVGFAYEFEEGVIEHVQLRHTDRINLLGLRMEARELIGAGIDELQELRTYENIIWEITPEKMVEVTTAALNRYKEILRQAWTMKDQATDAKEHSDLPSITWS